MKSNPRIRILFVEDEQDIQAVAKMALEASGGFSVKLCSSGKLAVKEALGFSPDLILLDVMMPELDGPATLKTLRQEPKTTGIPIVFMTAKVQANEIAQLKELGALEVIPKPFDPMVLPGTVKKIWEAHNG